VRATRDQHPAVREHCPGVPVPSRIERPRFSKVLGDWGKKLREVRGQIGASEHENVLDAMQRRLNRTPRASRIRRQTAEHPFGALKAWMGATHFLTKTLPRVSTEMSLHVLAYNLKRAMQILGIAPLMKAISA
jgi:hypothetical protein